MQAESSFTYGMRSASRRIIWNQIPTLPSDLSVDEVRLAELLGPEHRRSVHEVEPEGDQA